MTEIQISKIILISDPIKSGLKFRAFKNSDFDIRISNPIGFLFDKYGYLILFIIYFEIIKNGGCYGI